ncbi:MAG: phosphatase PAP2 family protein, partial [Eubacterium sp.]|nr:phosphatase PAP2 family protein [Eubacterium sp.]
MTGQDYDRYVSFFRKNPGWVDRIQFLNRLLTLTGYIVYPVILIYLFYKKNRKIITYLLIPAMAFGLVSFFRKKYNRPRPYEDPDIRTLTRREKSGDSFPSRHVFSYLLISVLLWSLCPGAGILMMVSGLVLAAIRVILGVHYPSDVIAGTILGILSGI